VRPAERLGDVWKKDLSRRRSRVAGAAIPQRRAEKRDERKPEQKHSTTSSNHHHIGPRTESCAGPLPLSPRGGNGATLHRARVKSMFYKHPAPLKIAPSVSSSACEGTRRAHQPPGA